MRSNIFTGFLFDEQWESATRDLPAKHFKQLFWELYDYHMSAGNKIPPAHPENKTMQGLSLLIQEQIKKRLRAARVFGKPRTDFYDLDTKEIPTPVQHDVTHDVTHDVPHDVTHAVQHPRPLTERHTEAHSEPLTERLTECLTEQHLTEQSRTEQNRTDGIGAEEEQMPAQSAPPPPLQSEEIKKAYGEKKNVLLTEQEYDRLINTLKIPQKYIDHFSEKLENTAYRYPNHAQAIQRWWEMDRHKPQWAENGPIQASSTPYTPSESTPSTFDTDDFFNANIRYHMGEEFLQNWLDIQRKASS